MSARLLLAASLAAVLVAPPAARAAGAPVVTVAAAADLKFALDDVVAALRARRPPVELRSSFGSSGSFFAQLNQGAPFDLFLSADVDYARRLHAAGLGDGDVFVYGIGRLSLWVPAGSTLDVSRGLEALRAPAARRIALANPRHAPYGRAAEAALRGAGLWDAVQPRLVFGESVAQAASFVQSGAADAGLIASALALAPAMADGRRFDLPAHLHPPLEQGGLVIKSARDLAAARAVRGFLVSAEGRALLARWGFVAPPGRGKP